MMTAEEKTSSSNKICETIAQLPEFQTARTVFAFLPLPSEPDLCPLFDESRIWGFARVLPDQTMEFREVKDFSDTIEGEFKIREPDPDKCPVLPPESADLLIIPGVGFCKTTGNRLGRGKGHYDRYLERICRLESPPVLIGVCFSVQLCDVEAEVHDIPMDKVITDRK